MHRINILDCTLREAPIKDMLIGADCIHELIKGLGNSKIDIIECGFLRNTGARKDNTIFLNPKEIEPYLKNKKASCKYALLVNYGQYNLNNLSLYNGKSIDVIRICFKKHQRKEVFPYVKEIKNKGYKVYMQNMDILGYTDEELRETIQKINELQPEVYTIADTFGSMYLEDLDHIYEIVEKELDKDIKLGFHAHNNLMLAAANTEHFISLAASKREIVVDGTIAGCGRGAGNTNTELLVEYINKKYNGSYNLYKLLDLINNILPEFYKKCSWGYNIPYFLAGIYNVHVFNINHLINKPDLKLNDLRKMLESLNENQRKTFDYSLMEKLYEEYFKK